MDIEIATYIKKLKLDEVCRTCLSECDEMTSLFAEIESTDEDDISFVYQILMNVSSLQILADDGLPTRICKNCVESANNAFKFKVMCERSEALLQTYVTHVRIKSEFSRQKDEETEPELSDEIPYESIEETVENIEYENDLETELQGDLNLDTKEEVVRSISDDHVPETENDNEELLLRDQVSDSKNHVPKLNERLEIQQQINLMIKKNNENLKKSKMKIFNVGDLPPASVQKVVIKPDIAIGDYCNDASEHETELKEEIEGKKSTNAALIAASEENTKLRERIKLKKMYATISSNEQNRQIKTRKKRTYFHAYRINEEGEKMYMCNFCEKEYKHSTSLTVHIRTHTMERPYLCTICGKGFKQFTGLSYHMRSHTGEQPYACSLCDKRYRQSASLTAHMRVHTGQRPFLCSVCGKGFRQAPDLGYHMRTHTKEKPYMCSVCGKCMSMQCHLVQHMRTHTGEKPFVCKQCGKGFASTTRLKRHEIIHTGLKPFACDVCKKAFNRASTLRVHAMTHSDSRPHVCKVCGKGFIQAHCLKSHLKSHF